MEAGKCTPHNLDLEACLVCRDNAYIRAGKVPPDDRLFISQALQNLRETDEQRAKAIAWSVGCGRMSFPSTEKLQAEILEAQRLAREDEREQCAKVAEMQWIAGGSSCLVEPETSTCAEGCKEIADAIRSRQPGGAK